MGNELRTNEAHAALFVALAESSRDFVAMAALDGRLLYANPATATLLEGAGAGSETLQLEELFAPEDQAFVREVIWPAVRRDGRWHGDFRLHHRAAGRARNVRLSAFFLNRSGTEPAAVALTGHDIGEQRRAEHRLRTLVEAGPSLSNSLDYHQTLENLAELVVRTLATFCIIDVFARSPSGGNRIERIASSHVDRGRRDEVRRLSRFRPSEADGKHPVARIVRDGASSLVEAVDDAWLESSTTTREHADALRGLGLRSLLAVPIVAGGKLLGALTCALADEARVRSALPDAYDAEDLFFVEELGRRGGVAIENALTFEHERSIAVSLQAASLPNRLPAGRGVRLHADYRPGSAEATIGGDWYDALLLDDGSFVFSIGDVVGHGLRAAILMTKLRQAMQAAALVDSDPNVVLAVADRTLRLQDPDAFATALAARYDPVTRRLRFAAAGHPSPLLRHPDGRVEELANPGILLGMRGGDAGPTRVVLMPHGATLLFYTDGLSEATRDIAEGQRRLVTALASGTFLSAANPAHDFVSEVLQGREAGDDVAVLVVTFDYDAVANQA